MSVEPSIVSENLVTGCVRDLASKSAITIETAAHMGWMLLLGFHLFDSEEERNERHRADSDEPDYNLVREEQEIIVDALTVLRQVLVRLVSRCATTSTPPTSVCVKMVSLALRRYLGYAERVNCMRRNTGMRFKEVETRDALVALAHYSEDADSIEALSFVFHRVMLHAEHCFNCHAVKDALVRLATHPQSTPDAAAHAVCALCSMAVLKELDFQTVAVEARAVVVSAALRVTHPSAISSVARTLVDLLTSRSATAEIRDLLLVLASRSEGHGASLQALCDALSKLHTVLRTPWTHNVKAEMVDGLALLVLTPHGPDTFGQYFVPDYYSLAALFEAAVSGDLEATRALFGTPRVAKALVELSRRHCRDDPEHFMRRAVKLILTLCVGHEANAAVFSRDDGICDVILRSLAGSTAPCPEPMMDLVCRCFAENPTAAARVTRDYAKRAFVTQARHANDNVVVAERSLRMLSSLVQHDSETFASSDVRSALLDLARRFPSVAESVEAVLGRLKHVLIVTFGPDGHAIIASSRGSNEPVQIGFSTVAPVTLDDGDVAGRSYRRLQELQLDGLSVFAGSEGGFLSRAEDLRFVNLSGLEEWRRIGHNFMRGCSALISMCV